MAGIHSDIVATFDTLDDEVVHGVGGLGSRISLNLHHQRRTDSQNEGAEVESA